MSYAPGAPAQTEAERLELEGALWELWVRAFFENWVRLDELTGCWLWRRTINAAGYAVGLDGLQHRVAFENRHGRGSAAGMDVHHTCEVKHCVNPDHLEAMTRSEHMIEHWDLRLPR